MGSRQGLGDGTGQEASSLAGPGLAESQDCQPAADEVLGLRSGAQPVSSDPGSCIKVLMSINLK